MSDGMASTLAALPSPGSPSSCSVCRRLPLAALALLMALFPLASPGAAVQDRAGAKRTTIPPPDLVGVWQGQGRVVNGWTSIQRLPLSLTILEDGTVTGRIGIASVAGGSFTQIAKKKNSAYVLSVNLDGALTEDGVIRRTFRLSLRPEGDRLSGSGASDGSKLFPGASRETMRRSMRLQVTSVSLTKRAAQEPGNVARLARTKLPA